MNIVKKRKIFLQEVAKKLADSRGMTGCAIFILNKKNNCLKGFCGYPDDMWPNVTKVRISMVQNAPVVNVVKNKTPIFISNAREDDKTLKWLAQNYNLLSILIIPLIDNGISIGAAMITDSNNIRNFHQSDIEEIMKITEAL